MVQGTDLQTQCNKYAARFTEVSAQVTNVAQDKGLPEADSACAQAVDGMVHSAVISCIVFAAMSLTLPCHPMHVFRAGKMFKDILSLLSDTESDVPEGLKESLMPLLTVEPTRYQLSSLGFVQRV